MLDLIAAGGIRLSQTHPFYLYYSIMQPII